MTLHESPAVWKRKVSICRFYHASEAAGQAWQNAGSAVHPGQQDVRACAGRAGAWGGAGGLAHGPIGGTGPLSVEHVNHGALTKTVAVVRRVFSCASLAPGEIIRRADPGTKKTHRTPWGADQRQGTSSID